MKAAGDQLAIEGGRPVRAERLPLHKPWFDRARRGGDARRAFRHARRRRRRARARARTSAGRVHRRARGARGQLVLGGARNGGPDRRARPRRRSHPAELHLRLHGQRGRSRPARARCSPTSTRDPRARPGGRRAPHHAADARDPAGALCRHGLRHGGARRDRRAAPPAGDRGRRARHERDLSGPRARHLRLPRRAVVS